MYAVVVDRGRQYHAQAGDRLVLDRAEAEVGGHLELPVALYADGSNVQVGAPLVAGRKAVCKVLGHRRGAKGVYGFFRRRKDSRRRVGFRHDQTVVQVVSIA